MEDEGLVGERNTLGSAQQEAPVPHNGGRRAAFREWMNTPVEYSRVRDPVHLKAAYLEWAEPEAAREQMRAHRSPRGHWPNGRTASGKSRTAP